MILSRIEIKGFKSFADKTVFEIGEGITCFAGPNGCGKSNLVDALRWALGEQKVSALRGDSMADVVFKGNAHRSGSHVAEVTLTFVNDGTRNRAKVELDAIGTAQTVNRIRDLVPNENGGSNGHANGELNGHHGTNGANGANGTNGTNGSHAHTNGNGQAQSEAESSEAGNPAERSEGHTAESSEGHTAESSEGHTAERSEGHTAERSEGHTAESSEGHTAESSEGHTAERSDEPTAEHTEEPNGELREAESTNGVDNPPVAEAADTDSSEADSNGVESQNGDASNGAGSNGELEAPKLRGENVAVDSIKLDVDYEEVSVTRRLYRSGDSEYLLNGNVCRLKDIREAFMDTGIGVSAYSFMAQGRIDAILSANPAERRSLFEEAAGISRYRQRRREVMRKLERVEQDLLRAGDVIAELERQMRSLKLQAGRARNYKVHSDRLQEIGRDHSMHSYLGLCETKDKIQEDKERLQEAEHGCRKALEECEAKLRELEQEEAVLAEQVSNDRSRLADVSARLEGARRRIEDLVDRRLELESLLDGYDNRKVDLERSIQEKDEQREALIEGKENLTERLAELEQDLVRAREEEQAAVKRMAELDQESRAHNLERDKLEKQQHRVRHEVVNLTHVDRSLLTQRRKQVTRLNELAARIATAQGEVRLFRDRVEIERGRRDATQRELDSCLLALSKEVTGISDLEQRAEALRGEKIAKVSRREVIESLIEKLEGVDEGVKVLLEAAKEGDPECPPIRGLLADFVAADLQEARALESALGPLAQALVVDRTEDAFSALRYLKARKLGRVTLIPLEGFLDVHQSRETGADRLLERVRYAPELWPLFEGLLGKTRLATALEQLEENPRDRQVTLEGDIREPNGALTGGGQANGAGLIRRRSELEALGRDIEALDRELQSLDDVLKQAIERKTALETLRSELEETLAGIVSRVEDDERQLDGLEDRTQLLRTEYGNGLGEIGHADLERQQNRERLHELEDEAGRVEAAFKQAEEALERTRVDRQEVASVRAQRAEDRRELDLEKTKLTERLRAAQQQILSIERSIAENREDLETCWEQLHETKRRLGDVDGERADTEESVRQFEQSRTNLHEELEKSTERLTEFRGSIETIRGEESEKRQAVEDASERSRDALLREQRNTFDIETLKTRVAEDFQFDLDEALVDYEDDPEKDWDAIDLEIRELKGKIARLGPVNMDAIEQMDEVEGRLTFMTNERDDLTTSRRTLTNMISEMDEKSRVLFAETFEKVRDYFQDVFRRLFNGGQADIMLSQKDEDIDAGVDIVAAPPGKRQQNITLLSGGERTLTAVALLFSLFKTKPSPICVLDEVDAALDEANIERFCNLLDDFEDESQFLIVTHSKRTMERGQVLYGITMQGDGVSTPMAIRIGDYCEN